MKKAALTGEYCASVPLRAKIWNGNLFIECDDPLGFFRQIGWPIARQPHCPPGARLKGVLLDGEGAYFDLCDEFGTRVRNVIRMEPAEAQSRISDLLIWEATQQ